MEFEVVTREGTSSGKIDLPDSVFNVSAKKDLLHQAVRSYLANRRQGTSSTKTRSEVKASGKKPWKQKGLGRARAGTAGSPVWVGGGRAHGPRPRDYSYSLPRKARRLAIKAALSAKARDGGLKVVESLGISEPRTRLAAELMKTLGISNKKCLFVLPEKREDMMRATGNIQGVKTTVAKDVNVYDIMNSDAIVIDKEAVGMIVEVLGR
ncbi:MAG: 50S ribosomal protein L4 [Candidatus Eisenbacteria bacterium]